MTDRKYSSNAQATTLSGDINDSTTTVPVTATTGFPATPFILALDHGTAQQEVVLVTNVAGLNLTVTRGYDNTTAQEHSTGAAVVHVHSAIDFRDSRTHENASTGVHGITGDVVGTTDTQALTNKDLSSGNTFPASLATDAEVTAAVSAAVSDHDADTTAHGATGAVVGTTNTQTLTNKTISADDNTISGLPASSFAVTNSSGNLNGSASQKAIPSGTVVGTSDTQTLTNKTLTSPTLSNPTVSGDLTATHLPLRMASGRKVVALSGVNSAPETVDYPVGRFTQTPVFVATIAGGTNSTVCYVTHGSGSTSSVGITVTVRDPDQTLTTSITVDWIAVQMSSSSATG